jgi:hypothetical protein
VGGAPQLIWLAVCQYIAVRAAWNCREQGDTLNDSGLPLYRVQGEGFLQLAAEAYDRGSLPPQLWPDPEADANSWAADGQSPALPPGGGGGGGRGSDGSRKRRSDGDREGGSRKRQAAVCGGAGGGRWQAADGGGAGGAGSSHPLARPGTRSGFAGVAPSPFALSRWAARASLGGSKGLVTLSQHPDPETAALAADLAVFWKRHIMGLPGGNSGRQSALRDRWASCSCSGWVGGWLAGRLAGCHALFAPAPARPHAAAQHGISRARP